MSTDPFGDIPLFRELQRLLAAGEGPINLEIGNQIARAISSQHPDPAVTSQDRAAYDAGVHQAEQALSGYTRLSLDTGMQTRVITRDEWVSGAISGWRWLLEHFAARLASGLIAQGPEGEAGPMEQVIKQIAPLLLGVQAGTLIGHYSTETLGRYDVPIPMEGDERLLFVNANAARLVEEYGFDGNRFTRWLTLRDAARHLVLHARPWTATYQRSLVIELVDSIEIDMADVERRIADIQSGGMEAIQEGMGVDAFLPVVPTERHNKAVARLQAFVAALDGYASHAAEKVAPALDAADARIDEGIARHEASPSEGKTLIQSMFGIERDRTTEAAGQTFSAAVVQLRGLPELNRLWDAADNLPTLAEIRDPFVWMERVLDEDA